MTRARRNPSGLQQGQIDDHVAEFGVKQLLHDIATACHYNAENVRENGGSKAVEKQWYTLRDKLDKIVRGNLPNGGV